MPADLDVASYFNYDMVQAGWVAHEARLGYVEVLDETEDAFTRIDGNGAVMKFWKHKSGTPEHLRFTTNNKDAWASLKEKMPQIPIEARVDLNGALAAQKKARDENKWFCWSGIECFEAAKEVVGHEILCCAMIDDPEWADDIYATHTDLAIKAIQYLEDNGVHFDGAWIYGDIAYNHAPFCSPKMYRNLVMPSHARQVAWFKERGLPVIYHTDGDFRPLIPSMLEIGIDCFQPLEAKAGMDLRELKPKYGDRASWMGNIDIMKLITNDFALIEAEVSSKIPMAMKGGGYIYHSDHSIAPGVKWETYLHLMKLVDVYGKYK
jgi:hypothetical protein